MITERQKLLVKDLLKKGRFLRKTINVKREPVYKLYEGNMVCLEYVPENVVEFYGFSSLLKKDKNGFYTLNLSKVRQLHGKSWVKKEYKNFRTEQSRKMNIEEIEFIES